MRHGREYLFLNYISILPGFRSSGIGKHLLRASIDLSRRSNHSEISLDVLAQNERALSWYEKMEFRRTGSATWLDIPIPDIDQEGDQESYILCGYPQARACHEKFGFSQIRLITPSGEYSVGLLGKAWFRIVQSDALSDVVLIKALRHLDASRHILAILPDGSAASLEFRSSRVMAVAHRLTATLDNLMKNLPSD